MLISGQAKRMALKVKNREPAKQALIKYNRSEKGRNESRNRAAHMRQLLRNKSANEKKLVKLKQGLGSLKKNHGINSVVFQDRLKEIRSLDPNYNHCVVSIKKLGYEKVYDLTVDRNSNFILSSGIIAHNSIGIGKTTIAVGGMAYDLYRLLEMVSPQKSYNLLTSTKIVFAIFNQTLSLSTDVVWDKMSQLLIQSPYFSQYLGPLGSTKKKNKK